MDVDMDDNADNDDEEAAGMDEDDDEDMPTFFKELKDAEAAKEVSLLMVLTVSGTRTDLNDDISGFEKGLVDNGVADAGVLENVLAKVLVEAEDVCVAGSLGRFAVVRAAAGPCPLLLGRLGHCGCWN